MNNKKGVVGIFKGDESEECIIEISKDEPLPLEDGEEVNIKITKV